MIEDADPADPGVSPLAHFGAEVRLERERLGLTREQVGKAAHCGYSLVAKIEAGKRVPTLDFAEACDRLFPHGHGRFGRLWPLALKCAFPTWFRRYVELEWETKALRMFHPVILPGIVQTEAYARAILSSGRLADTDDAVTARMERQRIFERNDPPELWVVLDEGVLTRTVGSPDVMREQLVKLLDLAETRPHVVQIVPEGGGHTYHGWGSPFGLMSFNEGADVVHVDGWPKGYLLAEPGDVGTAGRTYDLLRAMALPPKESAGLIESVIKDRYS
ncbi:helix-turn-helix domain-containing protein [Streptoverticillium reticulum]|uniref:helix-turn-helix domain-containing protein n=1 Tax=Streptoverticillium reticulum TaxID=1433415 RepID=UPI0039BF9A93